MREKKVFLLIIFLCLALLRLYSLSAPVKKILILGDSHAFGLKESIENYQGDQWEIKLKGISSSGLARDDFFNWIEWCEQLEDKFDYVFIILGTNDGQNMNSFQPLSFGTKDWEILYSARVERLISRLESHKRIFWVAIPPVRSEDLLRKTEYIQSIISEVCHFHQISILDSVLLSGDRFSIFKEDGIHLSRKGSDLLFYRILGEINKLADYRLPD